MQPYNKGSHQFVHGTGPVTIRSNLNAIRKSSGQDSGSKTDRRLPSLICQTVSFPSYIGPGAICTAFPQGYTGHADVDSLTAEGAYETPRSPNKVVIVDPNEKANS